MDSDLGLELSICVSHDIMERFYDQIARQLPNMSNREKTSYYNAIENAFQTMSPSEAQELAQTLIPFLKPYVKWTFRNKKLILINFIF